MTGWRIDHACPQCGARAELLDTDHAFTCAYCRVRLALSASPCFAYVLPPRIPDDTPPLFVPYWRCKGVRYDISGRAVSHRLEDSTRLAGSWSGLPRSLGLRPQAVRMRFAHTIQGDFLPSDSTPEEAVRDMLTTNSRMRRRDVLVNDTASLVYLPVSRRGNDAFDGLTGAALTRFDHSAHDLRAAAPAPPAFISMLCPTCGGDLAGERDDLVLCCDNCRAGFSPRGGKMVSVELKSEPGSETALHLPFWEFTLGCDDPPLSTMGDLAQLARLPLFASHAWADRPARVLLPAFTLRPDLFLRLARQMSLAYADSAREGPPRARWPARISRGEAVQALAVILADLSRAMPRGATRLCDVDLRIIGSELTYLPFTPQGSDLVHPALDIALNRPSLEFGRRL